MPVNKKAKIHLTEKNVVIPRNGYHDVLFQIDSPVYYNPIQLSYEMNKIDTSQKPLFAKKVDRSVWKKINSIDVKVN